MNTPLKDAGMSLAAMQAVFQGYGMEANVTATDQGDVAATFNVTISTNRQQMEFQTKSATDG